MTTERKIYKLKDTHYDRIVQAYSLDQLTEPISKGIDSLRSGPQGQHIWTRRANTYFYSWEEVLSDVKNSKYGVVTRNSKFDYYIGEAVRKGLASNNSSEPIAAIVAVSENHPFAHNEFEWFQVYDIGRLEGALNGTDPTAILSTLPEDIKREIALRGRIAPKKRNFEVWTTFCHEDCYQVKNTKDAIFNIVELAASIELGPLI